MAGSRRADKEEKEMKKKKAKNMINLRFLMIADKELKSEFTLPLNVDMTKIF